MNRRDGAYIQRKGYAQPNAIHIAYDKPFQSVANTQRTQNACSYWVERLRLAYVSWRSPDTDKAETQSNRDRHRQAQTITDLHKYQRL